MNSIPLLLLSQGVFKLGLALKPLNLLMQKKIFESNNIFIDETPVKTMDKKKSSKGYIWTIVGGKDPNPPYRSYSFRESRRHEHAFELLSNYHGVVHSDKYGAYVSLAEKKKIIWCPCFVHIRRKFYEAQTGDPLYMIMLLLRL